MSEELKREEILSAGPDDGDWTDVVRRATRARRRRGIYGAVLLTALVAVGVASAYALGHPIVDFGAADKAPEKVVVEFGALDVSAPSNFTPGLIPDQAREIPGLYLNGKPFKLYVAPTKAGGFCGTVGGCVNDRAAVAKSILWSLSAGNKRFEKLSDVVYEQIDGAFFDRNADRLELSYADGTSEEIPFVWVSAPIDAGFFVLGIPKVHQNSANRPTALTLYEAGGKVIARESRIGNPSGPPEMVDHSLPGYPHLGVPAKAIWEERRQLFDLVADDGVRIGLWVAPGSDGSTCVWSNQSSGCFDSSQVESNPPLALGFANGDTHVILGGERVAESIVRVEARFEDGDTVELTPREGYLIWPIPSRHFALGHRLRELVGYAAGGQVIGRQRVSTTERGLYPCAEPKDYGYGVTMCP
ncbi:MAG: hypothetical protein ABSB96_11035 [Gaiellaceae bacterium]